MFWLETDEEYWLSDCERSEVWSAGRTRVNRGVTDE